MLSIITYNIEVKSEDCIIALDQVTFTDSKGNIETVKLSFEGTTETASPSIVRLTRSDGNSHSNLIDEVIDANGYLYAEYTNDYSKLIAKIAVYGR